MSWFRKAKDKPEKEPADPEVDLVPSLAEVVWRNGLDRNTLTVAVPMDGPGTIGIKDRQLIWVDDSQQTSAWQLACLAVGSRPVSAAEFDAFLRRLARSARTFRMGDSSRNYLTQIRRMFDEEED